MAYSHERYAEALCRFIHDLFDLERDTAGALVQYSIPYALSALNLRIGQDRRRMITWVHGRKAEP